jgi:hypothetical protein
MEQMIRATRILRVLLQEGVVNNDNDREMYLDLKTPEIRAILSMLEEELEFHLVDASNAFYLCPNSENSLFGFFGRDFRRWTGSDGQKADGFLLCYIIMVLLNAFYGGHNQNPKQREFIRVATLVQEVDGRFQAILSDKNLSEELEDKVSVNFQRIAELWTSKQIYEEGKRKTKEGTVMNALNLLVEQKLIRLADEDREIRPTKKLDDLMLNYYLSDARILEIHAVFEALQ